MRLNHLLSSILLVCLTTYVQSQDYVSTAFTYNSTTRDTIVTFPTDDHNEWEKIVMEYSMRCKDALVSTSSDRNKGCGEWDYSCNTYITDSTLVDSTYRVSPDYIISNFTGSTFDYTSMPTYTYYQSNLREVTYNSISDESIYTIIDGTIQSDIMSGNSGENKKIQYIVSAQKLLDAGLSQGPISSLKLNIQSGQGTYKRFKLKMSNTTDGLNNNCLGTAISTVSYNDISLNSSDNQIKFYQDFAWDGASDILVEMSYQVVQSDLVLQVNDQVSEAICLTSKNNGYVQTNGSGYMDVKGDLSLIDKEITISYWIKGDDALPINCTILEAVDENNNRTVNIHMPWSNSQVYWDCGNEGASNDRINKLASYNDYKNRWNHWTFTKNANTGIMRIYLNGDQWHQGLGNNRAIHIDRLRIGASINSGFNYYGDIDDLTIWNKALSPDEIADLLCHGDMSEDPNVANQVLHYSFDNDNSNQVIDSSPNQFHADIVGIIGQYTQDAQSTRGVVETYDYVPSFELVTGNYDKQINTNIVLDSIANTPHKVDQYEIQGTDLVLSQSDIYYQSGDMPVYDEFGDLAYYITVTPEGSIQIGELEYYQKAPMNFEIMSFVTPYGINLDLGEEGKTWTFDVTDFGPILKGDKRIFLTRGGQWQEEMDIRFLFYKGTPSRNVKSISQIWPVSSENYTTIQNNAKFEPRPIIRTTEDESVVVKTTITGHGQEGEFIARKHYIKFNNIPLEWSVWKECADNPIYPQGGTWVYDRAGWCPGAASDTKIQDLTFLMPPGEEQTIDYGVNTASGDSRYIVNSQIVKYGPANFALDAALSDIVYPSQKIEYGRFNPNCGIPKVKIKNNGSETLTSLNIVFGILGGESTSYPWTGNLDFLEEEEVELFYLPYLAASSNEEVFFARVENPNGNTDGYDNNNQMESAYTPVSTRGSELIINFKTNNNSSETGYKVYDEYGEVLLSKGPSGLLSNKSYYDTLTNLNGCYKLVITDLGNNGLDWWANPNGGSGYIRLKNDDGFFTTLQPDFGKYLEYNFVAGTVTSSDNITKSDINVEIFPNPATDDIQVIAEGLDNPYQIIIYNQSGQRLKQMVLPTNTHQIHRTIPIKDLPSGIYILQIFDENGTTTHKFVKT